MALAKLLSVAMLIGLSSGALVYQSESKPEERYVFEDDGESLSLPASAMSSEELAREPEYYVPSDQVKEQFEKDDKEIMDRIAQIFNDEFRYERVPQYDVEEETSNRQRRSPQYVQQNNNNFDQYFTNGGQSKVPGGQLNQGNTNQGGIIRGTYPTGPQVPVVVPNPRPVQPQIPVVIRPVPLPGRVGGDPFVRCPPGSHGGYFPVQGDCRSFIHCDRGQPFRKQCGPGTFWNQNLLTCTHGPCTQNLVVDPPYPGRDQRPLPGPSQDIWQQRPQPGRPPLGASYGRK